MMAAISSELWCSSYSIHGRLHLNSPSYPCPNLPPKALIVMCHDGHNTKLLGFEKKAILSYREDALNSHNERSRKPYSTTEENVNGRGISEPAEHVSSEQKRVAKIHDFCLGIPFGGFILSGGLAGFAFSRNPTTLRTGVLFGGALLALSTFSLKIWRQGKSSLPFILGQAVLSAALLWRNFHTHSLTKKLFPTGFYAVISDFITVEEPDAFHKHFLPLIIYDGATMLCFYTYVVMSGGNPPPKKLKPSPTPSS